MCIYNIIYNNYKIIILLFMIYQNQIPGIIPKLNISYSVGYYIRYISEIS